MTNLWTREFDSCMADEAERSFYLFGYGSLVWRPDIVFDESHFGMVDGFVRRFWQASPDHRGTPESPGRVCTLVPVLCSCTRPCPSFNASTVADKSHSNRDIIIQNPICEACNGQIHPKDATHSWGLPSPCVAERARVHGTVYHIAAEHAAREMSKLLYREQAGYDCFEVRVACADGVVRQALTFLATPANAHWAGPPGTMLHSQSVFGERLDVACAGTGLDQHWSLAALAPVIARSVGPSGRNSEYLRLLVDSLEGRVAGFVDCATGILIPISASDPYALDLLAAVDKYLIDADETPFVA
jgi:cation transport regulator ChaC